MIGSQFWECKNLSKFILVFFTLLLFFAPCSSFAEQTVHRKHTSHHVQKKSVKTHKTLAKHKSKITHKKTIAHKTSKKKILHHAKPNKAQKQFIAQKPSIKNLPIEKVSSSLLSSIEQKLVNFVLKTVTNLRYTTYKFGGTHFDASRGIYVVDCSSYVDNILRSVYPKAFSSLVDSSGSTNPNSQHYYDFFRSLSQDPKHYWSRIDEVEKLRPGDILVFRYKDALGNDTGGHVMVVMSRPKRVMDTFLIRVADSASGRHSKDTRSRATSGIGIGTLVIKINPKTYRPNAVAWTIGARLKNNVKFAMARPFEKRLALMNG